jgi:hypothetical protein
VPRIAKRIAIWFTVLVVCFPLVMMARYPDTFTAFTRYVLRYHLELALPLYTHTYSLWSAYHRRISLFSRAAFVAFCAISAIAFVCLAFLYTYRVFWAVTVVPCIYLIFDGRLVGKNAARR